MTVSLVFTANLTYLADMDIIIASANVGNKQATTYRHHFWQLSPHVGHCFPSSVLYSFLATISLEFVSHHSWQLSCMLYILVRHGFTAALGTIIGQNKVFLTKHCMLS